jgi:hypothetical protein
MLSSCTEVVEQRIRCINRYLNKFLVFLSTTVQLHELRHEQRTRLHHPNSSPTILQRRREPIFDCQEHHLHQEEQ